MPTWHWLAFGGAAVLSAAITVLVMRLASTFNLGIVTPRPRDIHTKPIPRLGGVAVSLSFLIVSLVIYLLSRSQLTFVDQMVFGIDKNLFGIITGSLLLLIVGIVDDIWGMPPGVKLFFHVISGVILASSSVLIQHITNPLGGKFILGDLTFIFVVIWVVGMINVINFLDGLDGLASGMSLIATVILYMLAIKPEVNQVSMSVLAIVLAGALVGFLPFNFFPAKVFLGDSGSQVLGFLLATFAIISGGKLATAILVLGVPILDVVWVIARRLLTHQPVYQADRFHLHHRLLEAGFHHREAVLLLYTLSAGFGIIALQTQSLGKLIAAGILVAIMVTGGLMLVNVTARRVKTNER